MVAFSKVLINPDLLSAFDIAELRLQKCWLASVGNKADLGASTDFKAQGARAWITIPATTISVEAREELESKRTFCTYSGHINRYKHEATVEKLFPTKADVIS